jgi:hypothetical protein
MGPMTGNDRRILIAIPAYNEAGTIAVIDAYEVLCPIVIRWSLMTVQVMQRSRS